MRHILRTLVVVALGLAPAVARGGEAPSRKLNVLFIAIDDLRDWVGFLGDKQVKTPNLDRLAQRGLIFTHSYCAAPVCNPSRTAFMSGRRPGATGVYENNADWRNTPAAEYVHLTQHFMRNGYYCSGSGKIYHGSYPPPASYWNEFKNVGGDEEGDAPKKKGKGKGRELPNTWGYGNFKIGGLDGPDDIMPDYHIVNYALGQLKKKHEQPFFLACGLHKPHLAWQVPKKYFDLYPLENIQLPPYKENDLDDIPATGVKLAVRSGDHKKITEAGKWKECVQAYLATISFCDAMVGRLLDGLDQSAYRDNTIIILWSDHGWTLGEKNHWRKFALWEEATRSPMLMVVPGVTKAGTTCRRTVDFMSIYPTLCDLCGLDTPKHVQGKSIRSLLSNPEGNWNEPAITTYLYKNHAVRTERWRYIRYVDGGEELYDHDSDPHEWTNLANDTRHASVKTELARWLPSDNLPDAGKRGAKKGAD
jgi:arylsulfatase A-like enzyme